MFCKNCGKQLKDGEKFCPDCGTPVAVATQSASHEAAPGTNPGSTARTNYAPRTAAPASTAAERRAERIRRRKELIRQQTGQDFTVAHILAIICCIAVVIALFLPNPASKFQQSLQDYGLGEYPSIVQQVINKFEYMQDMQGYSDVSFEATFTAWLSVVLIILLFSDTCVCFVSLLNKYDLNAANTGIIIPIVAIILMWILHGNMKGAGYLVLLISSLGLLLFSLISYMLNQNKKNSSPACG